MKHFCPFPKKATELATEDGLPDSAVRHDVRACGKYHGQQGRGLVLYRSSKSAINQITKSLDIYLHNTAGDKAMAVALHPGTVKTGLSREFWESTPGDRLFSPQFSAEKLIDVINVVSVKGRGSAGIEGKEIPP
jgi:NAD(P)-dependent dehydrogenase (short-subunit alcohol dehydrogenase family)